MHPGLDSMEVIWGGRRDSFKSFAFEKVTLILTYTAGEVQFSLRDNLVPRARFSFGQHQERQLWPGPISEHV